MNKYMHGERQVSAIVQAGLDLWCAKGERAVTARAIARAVGLTHGGVLFHFNGMEDLKQQVKHAAIATGNTKVICEMLVARDPAVAHFTQEQRSAWLNAAA